MLDGIAENAHNSKESLRRRVFGVLVAHMSGGGMARFIAFLGEREMQLVVWICAIVIACVLGAYVIGKLRSKLRETDPGPSDFMTNFRELHSQGDLSDEEYRTIKSSLAARLKQQINRTDKDG
jgi:uncharacterized membrane protein